MIRNWKELSTLSKIVQLSAIAVAVAVIVLAILQIFDVWPKAGNVFVPLMGVNLLLQAHTQWKQNRGVALFSLCAAGFIFACAIFVFAF